MRADDRAANQQYMLQQYKDMLSLLYRGLLALLILEVHEKLDEKLIVGLFKEEIVSLTKLPMMGPELSRLQIS